MKTKMVRVSTFCMNKEEWSFLENPLLKDDNKKVVEF